MNLVEIYLNVDREIGSDKLDDWAKSIFEESRKIVVEYFNTQSEYYHFLKEIKKKDYDKIPILLEISVEEGSLKNWIILSIIPAFIFYGEIRQSIDYLLSDSKSMKKVINETVIRHKNILPNEIISKRSRLLTVKSLNDLFNQVESGELSPEEATNKAIVILQKDSILSDIIATTEFINPLSNEFKRTMNTKVNYDVPHHKLVKPKLKRSQTSIDNIEPVKTYVQKDTEKEKRGIVIKWDSRAKQPIIKKYTR